MTTEQDPSANLRDALAWQYSDRISNAAEGMVALLAHQKVVLDEVRAISLEQFPMLLYVNVGKVCSAIIVNNGRIIETDPAGFIADELVTIDQHGVRFRNTTSGNELHIPDHLAFETSPITEEEAVNFVIPPSRSID